MDDPREQSQESGPPPVPRWGGGTAGVERGGGPGDSQASEPMLSEVSLARAERVVQIYGVFAAIMAVVGLVGLLTGIHTLVDPYAYPQFFRYQHLVSGLLQVILSLVAIVGYGLAPILLPRTPWAWVVHLVLIGLGALTCCAAPLAVPLLICWLMPGVRALYGETGAL